MKNLLFLTFLMMTNMKLAYCASKESKDVVRSLHRYSQLIEAITDEKGKGLFKSTPINQLRLKNRSIVKSFLFEDHEETADFVLDGVLEWNYYETIDGDSDHFRKWACLTVDPKNHSELKVGGCTRDLIMESAVSYKRANGYLYFPLRKSGFTGIFGAHQIIRNDLPKNIKSELTELKTRRDTYRYASSYEELEDINEAAEMIVTHLEEILGASEELPKGYLSDADQKLFDEAKSSLSQSCDKFKK